MCRENNPIYYSPWAEPPKIHIGQDKTLAKTSHQKLLQLLGIESAGYYTDGSGINQKVGAAAVQLGQRFGNISVFLGSNAYYTVYAAELSGIWLAIHMALAIPANLEVKKTLIFIDKQAAIQLIHNPKKSSGQAVIKDFLEAILKLQIRGVDTELHWVPAHVGIPGNEETDIAAKKSTGWRTQTKRNGRQIEVNTHKTAQ